MLLTKAVTAVVISSLAAGQVERAETALRGGGPDSLLPAYRAIELAVLAGDIPGAVLLVGQGSEELALRAFGARSLVPDVEPMTVDTIFDLASLTKPVATATAVMVLSDRGLIDLDAPVSRYLPEFGQAGKEQVTVRTLLLHRGGLIPDNPLADYLEGVPEAWRRIFALSPQVLPGQEFVYTDVGYLVLGELVARVDGRPLDEFFRDEVRGPLGMEDAGFGARPRRCAPTEFGPDGVPLRGVVHDPRARALGGVAGHAGLFATARDLGRWCRMLLGGGESVLSPEAILEMTRADWLPGGGGGRSVGLDADTAYSSARGDVFPRGSSFGHTGFTGTALWLDPASDSFVILLTNRVHPDGRGAVVDLRRKVATAVALAVRPGTTPAKVLAGADVLAEDPGRHLAGARVALLTNHTGRTLGGTSTVEVLDKAGDVELVCILTPEHGYRASLEGAVPDGTDATTRRPIYSLYGESRRPTRAMLSGVDSLVIDLQDAGVRFYTYATTLGYAMEVAGDLGVRVVVLDRPNPLGGLRVDGPAADRDRESFICYRPIPVVHGMTLGELALMYRDVFGVACQVDVVRMSGWERSMLWEDTGLPWIPPSPNLRNPTQAMLYPAIGLLEASNVSVGRGTDEPFERIGAPWMDGIALARMLEACSLAGVRFSPIEFTPATGKFRGEACRGVQVALTDRGGFEAVHTGLVMAWCLNRLHSTRFEVAAVDDRLMNHGAWQGLMRASRTSGLRGLWGADTKAFLERRRPCLLYD